VPRIDCALGPRGRLKSATSTATFTPVRQGEGGLSGAVDTAARLEQFHIMADFECSFAICPRFAVGGIRLLAGHLYFTRRA
jgi:hypothetical protein